MKTMKMKMNDEMHACDVSKCVARKGGGDTTATGNRPTSGDKIS
jgi:hypothetical protein